MQFKVCRDSGRLYCLELTIATKKKRLKNFTRCPVRPNPISDTFFNLCTYAVSGLYSIFLSRWYGCDQFGSIMVWSFSRSLSYLKTITMPKMPWWFITWLKLSYQKYMMSIKFLKLFIGWRSLVCSFAPSFKANVASYVKGLSNSITK